MAKFRFDVGAEFDSLTADEMAGLLEKQNERQRTLLRGVKAGMNVPPLQGYPVAGVLNIGGDVVATIASGPLIGQSAWSGHIVGPTQGNDWQIRRLAVSGLTTGGTPDIVNLILYGHDRDPQWQFNGNNFAYTFGRGEMILRAGEGLQLVSVGTFAATGLIRLTGSLDQAPAEKFAELIL